MLADLVSPLYAIANFPSGPGLSATSVTTAMLAGGVGVVQLRAKGESAEQRRARALEMGPLCENAGVPLVINDDLELAFSGLPGIRALHSGQGDLRALAADFSVDVFMAKRRALGLSWGLSTHDLEQVKAAKDWKPDYIAFGPIFETTSKGDAESTVGVTRLAEAVRLAEVPVVAIGGLDAERGRSCLRAGARAVAVISALVGPTPAEIQRKSEAFRRRLSAE